MAPIAAGLSGAGALIGLLVVAREARGPRHARARAEDAGPLATREAQLPTAGPEGPNQPPPTTT